MKNTSETFFEYLFDRRREKSLIEWSQYGRESRFCRDEGLEEPAS